MVGIQHISTIYEQMQLNQIPHITLLLTYHIITNSIIISYAQNKEDAMDRCKWRKMIKEAR